MTTTFNNKMRFSLKKKVADDGTNIDTWGSYDTLKKHVPKLIKQAMEDAETNGWELFKITLLIDQEEWTVANF